MKKKQPAITINCRNCGISFKAWVSSNRIYCSRDCQKDEFSPAFKHGNYKDTYGYNVIYSAGHPMARKDGYILEHRLVMSNYLNRSLRLDELVHHKNEIKDDNRIENLEIISRSKHSFLHNIGKHLSNEHRKKISVGMKRALS